MVSDVVAGTSLVASANEAAHKTTWNIIITQHNRFILILHFLSVWVTC
jgi:hypothetical protein